MKPTSLNPGDHVAFDGSRRVFEFVAREPGECGRPGRCIFRNDETGAVHASDAEVIRRWHRIEESRPRG